MSEPIIRVEKLSKSFGSLKVLENVDFTVEKGEVVAIIGPSGTGKSVFLRSIDLLEKPDSGYVFIDGEEITGKGVSVDKIRRKMGMVYQQFNLFSHLDVLENIILAPMKLLKMPRDEAVALARELLDTVSLGSKLHAMPDELSGGQKQRIAIARCLAMKPEIMLFDEPTSALDPTMVGEVLATMRALAKQGMTMIIVTHEMAFAREVAGKIVFLSGGGIYEQGTPKEIFDNPQREATQAFIRKLKSFREHIDDRQFDLLNLQSRIAQFCARYNITERRKNVLLLSSEELLMGIIAECYAEKAPFIDLDIEYGEADGSLTVTVNYPAKQFNPFENLPESVLDMDENAVQLGYLMLRRMAKEISHGYSDSTNRIRIVI